MLPTPQLKVIQVTSYTTGSTDRHSIIIPTDTVNSGSSEADSTAAIIGGVVVAVVLIVSITTAVTVIILVRYRRGSYSTQKRLAVYHYHYMYYTVHTERL